MQAGKSWRSITAARTSWCSGSASAAPSEIPSIRYPLAHEALVFPEQEHELEGKRSRELDAALKRTESERDLKGLREPDVPSAELTRQ